jgi:hypothetical protein
MTRLQATFMTRRGPSAQFKGPRRLQTSSYIMLCLSVVRWYGSCHVRMYDHVILLATARMAGKSEFGLICASPPACVLCFEKLNARRLSSRLVATETIYSSISYLMTNYTYAPYTLTLARNSYFGRAEAARAPKVPLYEAHEDPSTRNVTSKGVWTSLGASPGLYGAWFVLLSVL